VRWKPENPRPAPMAEIASTKGNMAELRQKTFLVVPAKREIEMSGELFDCEVGRVRALKNLPDEARRSSLSEGRSRQAFKHCNGDIGSFSELGDSVSWPSLSDLERIVQPSAQRVQDRTLDVIGRIAEADATRDSRISARLMDRVSVAAA